MSKKNLFFRANFFALVIFISYLAFLPNYDNLPEVASFSDVLNHFIAFFVLAFLFDGGFRLDLKQIVIVFLAYGFFIEAVQYFLPNREFSFLDVVVDLCGVLAFVTIKKVATLSFFRYHSNKKRGF